jgi:beta-N-acetylhexosaminidase
VLKELRRIPPGFAAFLVIGAAVVTMLVLAAFDSSVGEDHTTPIRAAAEQRAPKVVELGGSFAKPKKQRAAPAPAQQPEGEVPAPSAQVPLRRLVGQKLIARMSGTSPSPLLLRRIRKGEVGGVILFADNVGSSAQVSSLTSQLRQAATAGGSQGFVIAVDQEGGPVKRLRGGPPNRSPAQIAGADSAFAEGQATGTYLSRLGINVNLAPVLDVRAPGSFIADRSFAATPAKAAELGAAFASGLQGSGVAATAKHFPGLGHATVNTDTGPSTVGSPRTVLDADLLPFKRAIDGQIGLVMMSNATYPAYGSGPAVLSQPIVEGLLRSRLGFGGVIVSDDLEAGAIRAVMPPASAAVAASKAGVDMMLLARSPDSYRVAYDALMAAVRDGRLDKAALEQSYARIQQLQAEYAG